jgi:hypothetical protein
VCYKKSRKVLFLLASKLNGKLTSEIGREINTIVFIIHSDLGEDSGVSATVAVASIKKIYVTLIYTSDFRYLFHINIFYNKNILLFT